MLAKKLNGTLVHFYVQITELHYCSGFFEYLLMLWSAMQAIN